MIHPNRFAKPDMTRRAAEQQLKVLLASAPDEKLFALTVDMIVATHRIDRRVAECVLNAAVANRRRFLDERAA